MATLWREIILSAKVFGHISQGLYRTPAGAIKELISNAYDADATLVRIHTGFPRFETFSCQDNGKGISRKEFVGLMERGIGNSTKRADDAEFSEIHKRPLIGRLGLGILSIAQICTEFDIVSHHRKSRTAFRVTIKFPPYTREEMDKLSKINGKIKGGEYQIVEETFDESQQGVRIFSRNLRQQFRKRMNSSLELSEGSIASGIPYATYEKYLAAIYNAKKPLASLNLRSDYDQLIFGLALAPPLPLKEGKNVALTLSKIRKRQSELKRYDFELYVDNMSLLSPVFLPSDREGTSASSCDPKRSKHQSFDLRDGAFNQSLDVLQHELSVAQSDLTFRLYELDYSNPNVAGR